MEAEVVRFNRTILECKGSAIHTPCSCSYGFNRTILECKADNIMTSPSLLPDLIEPYWNVKQSAAPPVRCCGQI